MKKFRVVYSMKGHVDIEAKDGTAAMETFDSMPVKKILENSSYEKINVVEQ